MGGDISLHEVFGIAEHVKPYSYVDRGGLDAQLRYALGAERHIAMHGASKQGKSWLRSRALDEGSFIVVQCQTGTTIESLFTQALGALGVRAELRRTDTNDFEGTLDFNGSGSLGTHLLGKLSFGTKAGIKKGATREIELQTLAQTPGNLSWVARAILASERRIVIEDCHYLQDEQLRDLAFVLKALAGYNLHVLIAGIWAQDHLLTYYNGDLSGRVEDVHLRWTDSELEEVLRSGSRALNLEMSTNMRRALIADAAGSVGLLQQLAEAVCREERIFARLKHPQYLTIGPSMERARSIVAEGMRQRYQVFAENFGDAVRRVNRSASETKPFLQCLIGFDDEALLQGIDSDQLEAGVHRLNGRPAGRKAVEEFLLTLYEAHGDLGVRPPVFSYNRHARKVYLVDHSLLYFRRYGSPHWPW